MYAQDVLERSFGLLNFADAQLGDKRRTKRLVEAANRIGRHPGGSLPDKFKSPTNLKALYRLFNCDKVTHQAVLEPVRRRTLRSMEEYQQSHKDHPMLILHDSTELDYSSNESLAHALGPIGGGLNQGYICHNSLAIDPEDRTILGLFRQILHKRVSVPENESKPQKRERASRESRLWLRGVEGLPADWNLVDVCDRGADTFEFLEHECDSGRRFVIRSCHDRTMWAGHGSACQPHRLHAFARRQESLGMQTIHVPKTARKAKICVSAAAVRLAAPHVKKGQHTDQPLPLWIVRVWEPNPPKDEAPLEWLLITNEPIPNAQDAWRVVRWYECRWTIEEFHKAMKTGCNIEQMQFTATSRLEPAIALLSVVATTLLNLRATSRRADAKTRLATEILAVEYVEVLSGWRFKQIQTDLTVHEFFYALARLGGHQNRKHDKPPGWIVLWKGWTMLQAMLDGAIAVQRKRKICG